MIEVIWHARGGQGAFTAARCLGAAASLAPERFALAFPTFGPERRGAPMRAYTKISDAPIGDRSASRRAAVVVYLDDTLFGEGWEDELAEGGVVLVNSKRAFGDSRVVAFDASGLAAEVLGRPIPNTAFLGAIAALTSTVTLEEACEGVRATMPAKLHDRNVAVVKAAYEMMQEAAMEVDKVPCLMSTPENPKGRGKWVGSGECSPESSRLLEPTHLPRPFGFSQPAEPDRIIPRLQQLTAGPEEFARSTCFPGGFLVSKNAGWRSERPVIDVQACTMCLNCYLLCPDGTIFKVRDAEGAATAVAVDYDFCKGCGVCAKACPTDCIAMVAEDGGKEGAA